MGRRASDKKISKKLLANKMNKKKQGGQQAPRSIIPHKGGRSERVECRVTPEIKAMLEEVGKSAADLLEEIVLVKHKALSRTP